MFSLHFLAASTLPSPLFRHISPFLYFLKRLHLLEQSWEEGTGISCTTPVRCPAYPPPLPPSPCTRAGPQFQWMNLCRHIVPWSPQSALAFTLHVVGSRGLYPALFICSAFHPPSFSSTFLCSSSPPAEDLPQPLRSSGAWENYISA